ncbi:MAG: hypothetical protein WCP88_05405 [bacterium]
MAKSKRTVEAPEIAPMEPLRPEFAPDSSSHRRHPASTIAAFVLAAGFGLALSGVLASEAGILPPLGGGSNVEAADQSPDASTDAVTDPSVDPAANADATVPPSGAPVVDPAPTIDPGPGVLPPPPGGGGDEDHAGGGDDGAGDDHDGGEQEGGDDD